jgi:polysaccharide chain length determinant protein (PEP-CTERM system associated)
MEHLRILLRDIVGALWKQRWMGLGVAWIVCIVGWVGVFMIPNQFEANARLYVDADAILTPLLKGLALDDTPSAQLDTLQRTLLSRPNLEKLIAKTDLELRITAPNDEERMIRSLANTIKVTPVTHNLFTISYRDTNPRLAYDVVRTVLDLFIESKTGNNLTDMANARTFVDQQIATYEKQLRAAEARRADFRARYIDLLPNDAAGGQSRLEQARATLTGLQGQLTDEQRRLALLQQELLTTPATLSADNPAVAAMGGGGSSQLTAAQEKLQELRLKFTDSNPDVIAQQNLVNALKSNPVRSAAPPRPAPAAATTSTTAGSHREYGVPNPLYTQLKGEMVDSEAKVASLQRQVGDWTKERDRMEQIARTAPGLQAEYTDLERGYDVLRKNYEELLARREAMHLADAADTQAGKVTTQVVDPPVVPHLAVAPNRPLLIAAVMILALGAGIGLPMLLDQFDNSMRNIEQLRGLELPVLGSVSLIPQPISRLRYLFDRGGLAAGTLVLLVAFGGLMLRMLKASI